VNKLIISGVIIVVVLISAVLLSIYKLPSITGKAVEEQAYEELEEELEEAIENMTAEDIEEALLTQ
jgi:hypothetical protein